jgi:hypothetical protein
MPDFMYNWSLAVLNFWHVHPILWIIVCVLAVIGAVFNSRHPGTRR